MEIKVLIRNLLREGLEETNVKLVSKSDKGNRYFKMLKDGNFQHYDMPKGELVPFSYGEEDRKRLVSKLSKVDKKIYRAWLKTPEGEKSMEIWNGITKEWKRRFPDSKHNVNESKTIVDKYGDILITDKGFGNLNFPIPQYKTKVKDSLVHIITRDKGISEKSFKLYDQVISKVGLLFKTNNELNELIHEFEINGS